MTAMFVRRSAVVGAIALAVAFAPHTARPQQGSTIPAQLTDSAFWKFVTDMSEPPGNFRSENLLSNETGFQWVIPALLQTPRAGKVYLGVAPEQNFTYIAAIKPSLAVIFDIRKGNLLEHLLYKALFDLSADRAQFVSLLFSKQRPARLDSTITADSLFTAYWFVPTDTAMYTKNKAAVKDDLMNKHHIPLTAADWDDLVWVYDQFYYFGPSITYSSSGGGPGGGRGGFNSMPNYADLMVATDGAGLNRAYLATEANWRFIKTMEAKNLIIPVIGNFAGPKAIKAVGAWLKEHNAVVTAFYTSNVEQYLWQDGIAYSYYDNVAALPLDSASVFIRSNGGMGGRGGFGGPGGMRSPNLLCSMQQLIADNKAGKINGYQSVFYGCR